MVFDICDVIKISNYFHILYLIWDVYLEKDLSLYLALHISLLIGHILNPLCCSFDTNQNKNIHSACSHAEINPLKFFPFSFFPIKSTRNLFQSLFPFSYFLLFTSIAFLQGLAMTPRSSPICNKVYQNGVTCLVNW